MYIIYVNLYIYMTCTSICWLEQWAMYMYYNTSTDIDIHCTCAYMYVCMQNAAYLILTHFYSV